MRTEEQFRLYAASLYNQTMHLSFTKTHYPEFQAILQMGKTAVPWMLEDLRNEEPGRPLWHWIRALHMITGQWPVAKADAGKFYKIRDAWVEWGIKHKIIPPSNMQQKMQRWRGMGWRGLPFRMQNFVWRLFTLPNKHNMKRSWDYWNAF